MKTILNLADVALESYGHGAQFACQDGAIGPLVGAKQLGYSLCVVQPGKRACPFHCHHVNEEMFLI
ncbi:MAG: hypothetical protein EXR77_17405 [Myxococcales bacterium]|nr:hypothetical protein [Myxococcales bacterium]